MKKIKMVQGTLLFFLALIMVSCGGGGGGGSSSPGDTTTVTPPSENITGTYNLVAFTVKYSNGLIFTDKSFSYSGTMKLGSETINQWIILNKTNVRASGTYTITYTTGTSEGIFHIKDTTGNHDASFSISGNELTTYSGVMDAGGGITAEEWDTWEKNSNFFESVASEINEGSNGEALSGCIGRLIYNNNMIK